MQFLGFILGVTGIIGWSISLFPLLAWINWIFLPIAVTGMVFSIIGMIVSFHHRGLGIAGIVICLIVIVLGVLRLQLFSGMV